MDMYLEKIRVSCRKIENLKKTRMSDENQSICQKPESLEKSKPQNLASPVFYKSQCNYKIFVN
jgi:hypothetical protein